LHGVISFHDDATPICGLTQSSSPIPTARSIPRDAVASRPSVTTRLRGLMSIAPSGAGAGAGAVVEGVWAVSGNVVPVGMADTLRTPTMSRSASPTALSAPRDQ